MTEQTAKLSERQRRLVSDLRHLMLASSYQPIYEVDNETLTAVELYLESDLIAKGQYPVLLCGFNGLLFKGCELVLAVN